MTELLFSDPLTPLVEHEASYLFGRAAESQHWNFIEKFLPMCPRALLTCHVTRAVDPALDCSSKHFYPYCRRHGTPKDLKWANACQQLVMHVDAGDAAALCHELLQDADDYVSNCMSCSRVMKNDEKRRTELQLMPMMMHQQHKTKSETRRSQAHAHAHAKGNADGNTNTNTSTSNSMVIKQKTTLLSYAMMTRNVKAVKIILAAWTRILTEAPRDTYAQLHFPFNGIRKEELLFLASAYPNDFVKFVCSLKPLQTDDCVFGITDEGSVDNLHKIDARRYEMECVDSAEEQLNLWASKKQNSHHEDEKHHHHRRQNHHDAEEGQVASPYFLPLADLADKDMLQAYVNVCETLNDMTVFSNEVCVACVRLAWRSFGISNHTKAMIVYWMYVGVFVTSTWLFSTLGSPYDVSDLYKRFIRFTQIVTAAYASYFGVSEYYQFMAGSNSLLVHFSDPWNIAEAVSISFVIVQCIIHAVTLQETDFGRFLASVSSVLIWFKTLYFLRAFARTGPLIAMIFQIASDIIPFLVVLATVLFGFAEAFWVLCNVDNSLAFSTVPGTLINSFAFMLGGFDPSAFTSARLSGFAAMLSVVFMLIVAILLLNLLIALMGNSYSNIQARAELQFRWEQASSLLEQAYLGGPKKGLEIRRIVHLLCEEGGKQDMEWTNESKAEDSTN